VAEGADDVVAVDWRELVEEGVMLELDGSEEGEVLGPSERPLGFGWSGSCCCTGCLSSQVEIVETIPGGKGQSWKSGCIWSGKVWNRAEVSAESYI
jgi:hypothetical protein